MVLIGVKYNIGRESVKLYGSNVSVTLLPSVHTLAADCHWIFLPAAAHVTERHNLTHSLTHTHLLLTTHTRASATAGPVTRHWISHEITAAELFLNQLSASCNWNIFIFGSFRGYDDVLTQLSFVCASLCKNL